MAEARQLFLLGVDTEESVLTIRATAMSLIGQGKTVMEWKSTDIENGMQFSLPPAEVIRQCNDFLQRNWPSKYGRRIKRTSFDYRFS